MPEFRWLQQNFAWMPDPHGDVSGGIRLQDDQDVIWNFHRDGTLSVESDAAIRPESCIYLPAAAVPFFMAAVFRSFNGAMFASLIQQKGLITAELRKAGFKRAEYLRDPAITPDDYWNPELRQFEFYYLHNHHVWKPDENGDPDGGIRIAESGIIQWHFLRDGTYDDHNYSGGPHGPCIYVPELLRPLFWAVICRSRGGFDISRLIQEKYKLTDDINKMLTRGY